MRLALWLLAILPMLAGCAGANEGALDVEVAPQDLSDLATLSLTLTSITIPTYEGDIATGTIRLTPSTSEIVLSPSQGAKALEGASVEAGKHRSWSLYVERATGTLADGASVDVAVPDGRLQYRSPFTVTEGATAVIVAKVGVTKTGESYALVARG